jgi:hypothetical protein
MENLETAGRYRGGRTFPVPESSKQLRKLMVDASVRSMNLQGLRSYDLTRRFSSLRSGEVADLRSGRCEKFGLNRLLTLHERLKSKVRFHVLLPACPDRESDPLLQKLFRALADVDDACESVAESLGERSYPLTRVAVLNVGTTCMLAVDSIRKSSPTAWRREAPALAAILFQAEEMLEAVREKGWKTSKAIHALRVAAGILEEAAQ